jgi:aldose 1-epimerase
MVPAAPGPSHEPADQGHDTRTPGPGAFRQTANGRLYQIRSGRHGAVIAGVAATLLSWRVGDQELLLTHDADVVGDSYQGKVILPWPNRIDHGRYPFAGVAQQTPITEPGRDAALHGLMSWVEWEPVTHEPDRVVLGYLLHPQYGYPFQLEFQIEYAVTGEGLRTTMTARNTGAGPAPFGAAYHPYFRVSSPTVEATTLSLPASTYYLTNDRLIPTGKTTVVGTPYDFRAPRPIGGTTMDTAFTDLARGSDGTAVVRLAGPEATVELWVDETLPYLQVYTDDGAAPDRPPRGGITVEPMTCAPNAFNTGDGLIVLQPNQTYRGQWGLRAAT